MTDTTDTAALLEKLNAQTNSYDTVIIRDFEAKQLVAAFEAERQRADDAHKYGSERDAENESLMLTVGRLRVEIAELKGEQVPVSMDALRDAVAEMSGGLPMEWMDGNDKGHHAVPFINFNSLHRIVTKFTAPQKPVVLPHGYKPYLVRSQTTATRAAMTSGGEWLHRDEVTAAIEAAGGKVAK